MLANDSLTSDNDYTDELKIFRSNVKKFMAANIAPYVETWDAQSEMPRDVWRQLGEAGLLCVDLPVEYGGSGVPVSFSAVVMEELAYVGFNALAAQIAVHSDIVAHYIFSAGSDQQKQQYLPRMATGECVGAVAMTEPAAGSDLQGIRTSARRDGDEFVINGSKTFISNGGHGDLILTVARSNPDAPGSRGMSLFLVEATTPGFSRGKRLEKIGLHAADTLELFYEDVRVGESQLLGELDQGFAALMNQLPRERWALAVSAVAASEAALEWTVAYVQERQVFGGPLAKLQNTRFRIAEMKTEVAVNRAFLDSCTRLLEQNLLDTATASMAKLSSTEAQGRVLDGCLQLFGGYGFMREYPISRAFVDARVQRIYGGTSEIMKEIIGRAVLGR